MLKVDDLGTKIGYQMKYVSFLINYTVKRSLIVFIFIIHYPKMNIMFINSKNSKIMIQTDLC